MLRPNSQKKYYTIYYNKCVGQLISIEYCKATLMVHFHYHDVSIKPITSHTLQERRLFLCDALRRRRRQSQGVIDFSIATSAPSAFSRIGVS